MYARFQLSGMALAVFAMVNLSPNLGAPLISPEFESLPPELKLMVVEQLPLADAARFGLTSRSNNRTVQDAFFNKGQNMFQLKYPQVKASDVVYRDLVRARDAVGMLPNGQSKSTMDLMSPQQLKKWLNYYEPSLHRMLNIVNYSSSSYFLTGRQHPSYTAASNEYYDLNERYPIQSADADDLTKKYLEEIKIPWRVTLRQATTGLLGMFNKRLYQEIWPFIHQYFLIIEAPGLPSAMDDLDGDPLAHVLNTWVGGKDPARLRHYLINHMLYFIMPSVIAAFITEKMWQAVETLIDNVMAIEQVYTWMAEHEAQRIDYYGFAMFVAAFAAANGNDEYMVADTETNGEAWQTFLQTMHAKPGVNVQDVLDCKPKSNQAEKINDIFLQEFGVVFGEREENICRPIRMKIERSLNFKLDEITLQDYATGGIL
ncbi:hypothetical protein H4R35_006897 [Dimargaris xerosporica]|nr:hypothetical protein H4R35_006897 [Dimargaris xerosporica]